MSKKNTNKTNNDLKKAKELLDRAIQFLKSNKVDEAFPVLDELIDKFENFKSPDIQLRVAGALLLKGDFLDTLEKQIVAYDEIIMRFEKSSSLKIQEVVARALFNKGFTCADLKRSKEAIFAYNEVILRFGNIHNEEMQLQVANASLMRANILDEWIDKIKAFDEFILRFKNNQIPKIKYLIAIAMFNKGVAFEKENKYKRAIAAYDDLSVRFKDSKNKNIKLLVVKSLCLTAQLFDDSQKRIDIYDGIIKISKDNFEPEFKEITVKTLLYKGIEISKSGDDKNAIIIYNAVVSLFENDECERIQSSVALAMFKIGLTYQTNDSFNDDDAIVEYDKIISKFENNNFNHIQIIVVHAIFNKGHALDKKGEIEKAENIWNKLIYSFKERQEYEIQIILFKAFIELWTLNGTETKKFFNDFFKKNKISNTWNEVEKWNRAYIQKNNLFWDDLYDIKEKEELQCLFFALASIFEKCSKKIKDVQLKKISDQDPLKKVCHFTSVKALYSILGYSQEKKELEENKNILRAYNAIYMNDPSEGQTLIDYSHKYSNNFPDLTDFFKDEDYNWIDHDAAKSVYCISFTNDNDSLTLWRAYGRDGRGVGIVIPVETLEQTDESIRCDFSSYQSLAKTSIPDFGDIKDNFKTKLSNGTQDDCIKKDNVNKPMPENLYEVKYISLREKNINDSQTEIKGKEFADNLLESLRKPLEKIGEIKDEFEKEIEKYEKNTEKKKGKREKAKYQKNINAIEEINKATRESFAGILYLFKDAQYAAEKEYRMLTMRRRGDKNICIDEQNPPHLHLETRPFIFEHPDTEIIIGPAVELPENVALSVEHILSINSDFSNAVKVKYSKVNYRPAKK